MVVASAASNAAHLMGSEAEPAQTGAVRITVATTAPKNFGLNMRKWPPESMMSSLRGTGFRTGGKSVVDLDFGAQYSLDAGFPMGTRKEPLKIMILKARERVAKREGESLASDRARFR